MKVDVLATGCLGFCEKGPMVVIYPDKYFYQSVKVKCAEIVSKTVGKGEVISRLLYRHPETKKTLFRQEGSSLYKKQLRVVFGSNGMLDRHELTIILSSTVIRRWPKCFRK